MYFSFFYFLIIQVCDSIYLPQLNIDDTIIFENMGAYTIPIASPFNGFPLPRVEYYIERKHLLVIFVSISSFLSLFFFQNFNSVERFIERENTFSSPISWFFFFSNNLGKTSMQQQPATNTSYCAAIKQMNE